MSDGPTRRITVGVGTPRLVIRDEQLRVLELAVTRAFVERLAQKVATCLPLPLEAASAVVEDAIARAASYDIHEVSAVESFVDLVLALGQRFDEQRWARRILSDRGASSAARLAAIHTTLKDRQRVEP